jgi:hypothetical protein
MKVEFGDCIQITIFQHGKDEVAYQVFVNSNLREVGISANVPHALKAVQEILGDKKETAKEDSSLAQEVKKRDEEAKMHLAVYRELNTVVQGGLSFDVQTIVNRLNERGILHHDISPNLSIKEYLAFLVKDGTVSLDPVTGHYQKVIKS